MATFKLKEILKYWKTYAVVLIPLILSVVFAFSTSKETRCGFVILVMACYWMTEAIPIAVTALIPVVGFPLLGVLSSGKVCLAYMKETNMLFMGGLMVAIAVEHCNLHKRIALFVILHVGQSPRRLMAGFMLTTMTMSMWITNTASTAMMVPIVDAILQELYKAYDTEIEMEVEKEVKPGAQSGLEAANGIRPHPNTAETKEEIGTDSTQEGKVNYGFEDNDQDLSTTSEEVVTLTAPPPNEQCQSLKDMYFLAVAYSANIGGTGSLTGTGPNLVVKEVLDSSFTDPSGLNFASWMAFNVPGMLLCTFIGWVWLQILFMGVGSKSKLPKQTSKNQRRIEHLLRANYDGLGSITYQEKTVLTVFVSLVFLWFFREPGFMYGWQDLWKLVFGDELKIGDATPAIFCAIILCVMPTYPNFWPSSNHPDGPSTPCLPWSVLQRKIPWGIVLLLGGGFAMAEATNKSGLSVFLGESLTGLKAFPSSLSVFLLSIATAMATEVASNTATASIIMPIFRDLSLSICVNPLYFMLPAAVCCSYAFMIPVATPANAIVYGAAGMKIKTMMKAGIVMNVLCVFCINIMINTLGISVFKINEFPSWANSTTQDWDSGCFDNVTKLDDFAV